MLLEAAHLAAKIGVADIDAGLGMYAAQRGDIFQQLAVGFYGIQSGVKLGLHLAVAIKLHHHGFGAAFW